MIGSPVDYSTKSLEICKNNSSNIELVQDDIRNYYIEKDKYDLIWNYKIYWSKIV